MSQNMLNEFIRRKFETVLYSTISDAKLFISGGDWDVVFQKIRKDDTVQSQDLDNYYNQWQWTVASQKVAVRSFESFCRYIEVIPLSKQNLKKYRTNQARHNMYHGFRDHLYGDWTTVVDWRVIDGKKIKFNRRVKNDGKFRYPKSFSRFRQDILQLRDWHYYYNGNWHVLTAESDDYFFSFTMATS